MPDLTLKLPVDAADDALYHSGLLPLDRQAPAVMGAPLDTPDMGGALPPIPNVSQMGSPAGPPGSADFAGQKLAADESSYKPWGELGTLGKIGRVAGYGASAIVPHVAGMIPSTPLGHIAQINADTEDLRGAQQEERTQSQERSEEGMRSATEANLASEEQERLNPPARESEKIGATVDTGEGIKQFNPETGRYDISVGPSKPAKENDKQPLKVAPGDYVQQPDGSFKQVGTPKGDKPDQAPHQLMFVPQTGGGMKVVEAKPGMELPSGATTATEAGKEQTTLDSKAAAEQYADDYMSSKRFTGAGDEALMEKYFELAKPSSGFRMTQTQIEMLTKAQDMMNSVVAKGKHLFSPESPYFSDTLRQQIVDTMKNIDKAGSESRGTAGKTSAGGVPEAGTVEGGYKFKGGDPGKKENWEKQ